MSTNQKSGGIGRSVLAILAGIAFIFVTSLGTDQLLHWLGVYPPWGERMDDHRLNALALGYRLVYQIIGAFFAASLAPSRPMRHVLILGGIGLVLSALGGAAAIRQDLGPAWYPIALAISALPTSWLGGYWFVKRQPS